MNKIVREHYPVENLPEDLRVHFPAATSVTVEVTEDDTHPPLSRAEAVEIMRAMQRHTAKRGESVTTEEAVRRIRELRDEWDD
ncbi:hypothetical protein ASD04_06705 [Devosia sp. Root436]|jgi:hypothetical protein|uniref:hypothetical protein n=1 Tax=Devosia sp. Root436 TaxID=1736537 RepID=UPI0007015471|nr:hypothetical protein [Devosia sp. Root436]KQX40315.1 hypothetical protein ASD04_06705 [Devosia sp. Root436]